MNDTERMNQILTLYSKSENELRTICNGLQIETDGSKKDIVRRIIGINVIEQKSILQPVLVPLRAYLKDGSEIKGVKDMFLRWRKQIFNNSMQRDFTLVNIRGEKYSLKMNYINCSSKLLKFILEHKWYISVENIQDVLDIAEKYPERFNSNIVRKPHKSGNTFLMLHLQHKDVA